MPEKIRTFIAIELPGNIIDSIGDLQKKIKQYGFSMRWVRPENIHLTLKFLGDINPEMVQPITNHLEKICQEFNPIKLLSSGIGVFPNLKRPRVLWAGIVGDTNSLKKVQLHVDSILSEEGFPKENRPFKGHLTIGRFKTKVDSKKLASAIKEFSEFETEPFMVGNIVFFKSELKPDGAVYSKLAIAPLHI